MPRSSRVVAAKSPRSRNGKIGLVALWVVVAAGLGATVWAMFLRDGSKPGGTSASVEPTSLKSPAPEKKPAPTTAANSNNPMRSPVTTPQTIPVSNTPTLTMGEKPGVSPSTTAGLPTVHGTMAPPTGVETPLTRPSATPNTSTPAPGASPAPTKPAPGTGAAANPGGGMEGSNTITDPQSMPSSGRAAAVERMVTIAESELASGKMVEARATFNRALHHPEAGRADQEMIRGKMSQISDSLTFSTVATPGDATSEMYAIEPGDSLVRISRSKDLGVDWRFIQRVNKMSDPGKLRVGQKLKLVRGPFHAVVHKNDYRLDLYSDAKDPEGNRLFIKSFRVGLGELNSTPVGAFLVREGSKLINPHWVNPRTGEKFDANDPKNPIGERWIGLVGTEPDTEKLTGYGIHGTVEPESIGQQKSMGCVRMAEGDVEMIYELLTERKSTVLIVP